MDNLINYIRAKQQAIWIELAQTRENLENVIKTKEYLEEHITALKGQINLLIDLEKNLNDFVKNTSEKNDKEEPEKKESEIKN